MDHELEKARNMKFLQTTFEQLSHFKINFHKSELFCCGEAANHENDYMKLIGCNTRKYPFRYSGIPIHRRKLSNNDWGKVEKRFERKLNCWKVNHLSYGAADLIKLGTQQSSYVYDVFLSNPYRSPHQIIFV